MSLPSPNAPLEPSSNPPLEPSSNPPLEPPRQTASPPDPGRGEAPVTVTLSPRAAPSPAHSQEVPPEVVPPVADPPHEPTIAYRPAREPFQLTFSFEDGRGPTTFPSPDDRYKTQSFIARGGMGEVWTARDRVLNREVAVKILREDVKDRTFIASRFIEEARITSKLDHPGIPPIHDLGTFCDGRPYIAMKLIRGRTLSDLLAHDRPELNELLRIFDYVCQAVAAVHDKRVIHRDLKPGNVMVGRFNEVQVMDWGLAKVLGEASVTINTLVLEDNGPQASLSVIESDRDPSSYTRVGSLLGTPAYMPPEQAKGEIDKTDTRSDVFALGAMLCELLTGRPPYWAATSAEVQAYAIAALLGPAFERLDSSDADGELIALAKECLSADPDDRPADGKQVADRIKAYRESVEDRLRKAERERAAAEAQAAEAVNTRREAEARAEAERAKAEEQRKRRREQLALAATALLLLAVGSVGAWWSERQTTEKELFRVEKQAEISRIENERKTESLLLAAERSSNLQRNAQAIETLLLQVERALRRDDIEKALLPLSQIDKRLPDGGAEPLVVRIEQARTDMAMLRALDTVDDVIGSSESTMKDQLNAAMIEAFREYGIEFPDRLSLEQGRQRVASAIVRINASTIRERLLLGLDLWHLHHPKHSRPTWMRRVLDSLDPDPFRIECRNLIQRGDLASGEALLKGNPDAFRQPARFATLIGQTRVFPTPLRDRILQGALESYPNSFPLLLTMLRVLEGSQELRQEILLQRFRWSQAAIAVRPTSNVAWRHLASAHFQRGAIDDAIRCGKKSLRLGPNDLNSLNMLGYYLLRCHDPEAALVYAMQAVERFPNSSSARGVLGAIHARMNQHELAMQAYQKALEIEVRNGVENPASFNNRGYAYLRRGDLDKAIEDFRKAIHCSGSNGFPQAESNLQYARDLRRSARSADAAPPPRAK